MKLVVQLHRGNHNAGLQLTKETHVCMDHWRCQQLQYRLTDPDFLRADPLSSGLESNWVTAVQAKLTSSASPVIDSSLVQ